MGVIDQRGRLFGRINLFDAGVILGVLAMLSLAVIGYRLLKVPPAPRVTDVSPRTLTAGPDLRLTVKGENLLPYMHVFLQRTGQPTKVMHDLAQWVKVDNYTLANAARTAYRVESPTLAEIEATDNLMPGTYDIVFYDETKIVGVAQAAFTVVPAPKLKIESNYRETVLRVTGAFVGMNREAATRIKAGAKIVGTPPGSTVPDENNPQGEIAAVKAPAPDVEAVDTGIGAIHVGVVDRWKVDAELRLRCVLTRGKCFFMEEALAAGQNLQLQSNGTVRTFVVTGLAPENR